MQRDTYNEAVGEVNNNNTCSRNKECNTIFKDAQEQIDATHEYVQRHHLNELFAHLMQLVLYYQPENSREFLSNEVKRIREQKVSTSLFTERDLETMFDMMDVTKQQWITVQQLRNTCKNLAATNTSNVNANNISDVSKNNHTKSVGITNSSTGNPNELSDAQEEAIANAADANGHVSLPKFKEVLAMELLTKNVWSAEQEEKQHM